MPTEVKHGFTGECFPDHFNLNARPKIKEQKPGQLSDEEIEQFFTKVSSNSNQIILLNKTIMRSNIVDIVVHLYHLFIYTIPSFYYYMYY